MKKLFYLLSLLFVVSFTSCSEAYDDSDIVGRLDDLEKEVEDLREEVEASKTLLNALANNLTIKSVAETTEGYVITFSDDSSITVKHGKKGEDGKDGEDGADGEDGKDGQDGADGKDGDNLIASITINEDSVTFVLTNGQTVTIALNGDAITPDDGEEELPTEGNPLENVTCASNEILYTTKYGLPIELGNTQGFGGNLVYNTYEKGIGRLTFGNDVTAIPDNAFKDCNSMEYIKLPEGVTSVGTQAFYGCLRLASITIPDSVTSIGEKAFYNCSKLASVTIGNGVTSIGKSAFNGCTGELIVNCDIPSASSSSSGAFYGSKFTKVTIGNSVTSIGSRAFYGCTSLASVTIGNGVTSIGELSFYGCAGELVLNNKKIVESTYSYSKDLMGTWFNGSEFTSVVIGGEISSIGEYAFYDRESLASVTIGEGVTSIGEEAFWYCSSLASITIPDSITSIGDCAFYGCSSLTSITIPDSVTSIGGSAFSGCTGELVLNNKKIVESTYSSSKDLMGTWFNGSKFTSVIIGGNISSIGDCAFSYCSRLANVVIGNGVTSIGEEAFWYCSSLASITIPDSVTSIGEWAFRDCSSLASVTIGNGVTSIGSLAFYGCTSLASITIPESITEIGVSAFNSCSSLAEVYCKPTIPPKGSYNMFYDMFYNNASGRKIYIPVESVVAYKTAEYWLSYADLFVPYDFENGKEWETPESWKKIYYTSTDGGIVTPYNTNSFSANTVSNTYENGQGVITFDGDVTSIGYDAFYGCSSLASITIPESATSIGEWAFGGCSSLTSITIPDNVTSIGYGAFQRCTSLKSICIGNGVTLINSEAFSECVSLANVILGGRVTEIKGAFRYCTSLSSITIPDSVTEIGSCAFQCCESLTSILIPDSVTTIGIAAFEGCTSLTSITIPNSVTKIGESAFSGCTSLTSFYGKYASEDGRCLIVDGVLNYCTRAPAGLTEYTIPDSVTSIGERAFSECYSLRSVTIPDSVTSIGDYAFQYCTLLTSLTIPDSISLIGFHALNSCTSLTSVYCKATTPPTVVEHYGYWSAFDNNASGRKIYVPTESVNAYKSAEYWSDYADSIVGYDF